MAPRIEHPDFVPPAVVLLASGGHTQIVHVEDWGGYVTRRNNRRCRRRGVRQDRPGHGSRISGRPRHRPGCRGGRSNGGGISPGLPDRPYHFSFSGLKTSVITYLKKAEAAGSFHRWPTSPPRCRKPSSMCWSTRPSRRSTTPASRSWGRRRGAGQRAAPDRMRRRGARGVTLCSAPEPLHRQRRHDRGGRRPLAERRATHGLGGRGRPRSTPGLGPSVSICAAQSVTNRHGTGGRRLALVRLSANVV